MKTFVARSILLSFALVSLTRAIAQDCGELVISSLDRGWYNATGHHNPNNENYYCGDGAFGPGETPLRNWFAFSIPLLTQQVVSASLRIRTFEIASTTGSETYQLRHVSTAVPTLRAGGTGLTSIYADLGDGAIYGSRVFFNSESSQYVSIPLNSVFISSVTAAARTELAIGGEVTSLDQTPGNAERLFSTSAGDGENVQLVLRFSNPSPLAIRTQPQSQAVGAGSSVGLNIQACGSSALNYQWQFNGTNLAASGPTLNLFNVTSNNAGPYRVIVSNLSGTVTSDVATLTVFYQAPTVTAYVTQGVSPAYSGNTVTLCANASGVPPPSLQWQFNGTNLLNQTGTCLYLQNAQTNHSGNYTVVASNAVGVATSAVITLVVTAAPPVYAYFPYEQSPIAVGYFAYMCAVVNMSSFSNGTTPALQWQFRGVDLPGETNLCLYVHPVDTNKAGLYTVTASNISGAYTSPPIELTVYHAPPTTPHLSFALGTGATLIGNDVTICSSVGGSPPLSYQWRLNGTDLPGENASCLTMLAIGTNRAGNYSVVVSNIAGVVTSAVLTVTVNYQPPIFARQPASQTVVEGATVTFSTYALAGPPPTHFLQLNETNLPVPFSFDGSTGGGFTLLDVTPADAGNYRVIASNYLGMATSIVATLLVTPAGPLDRWMQRNPLPQSQPLFSVAHGNGLFVAVGGHGTVLSSTDGTNWFLQGRRVDLTLFGVAYGAGLFVAVGEGGTILSSADGTNWTYRYSAPLTDLNAITYGNGRFVAVGVGPGQTFVLLSADGVTWERTAVPSVLAELGIAFGNGAFVAVGSTAIITSTNGFDWSVARSFLADELESVSFVHNQFVAVGDRGSMFVSSDGTSWTGRNSGTTRRLLGVAYGNDKFVAAGVRGTVLTSSDAITWTEATSGTPDRLETVAYANGLFIATGENGTIITSTNGTAWGKQNRGVTRDLDGMALANGTIVIVGKGGSILTSTDGTNYTQQNTGITNDLHGIAWGDGLWVAVGEPGIIITSSNAVQWTSRNSGATNSLKGATYANGQWVVVGTQGSVITSSDGVNWFVTVTTPNFDLNDVAYGNGVFVIAGDGSRNQGGSAFVSATASGWTWLNYPFSKNLRSVLFTNGLFFVTANDGYVFTSTNGLNWSPYVTGSFANLRGATFAHGLWTVVGNRGTILTSPNFLHWTLRPSRTFENFHEIIYLDGKLVTIGNRGTVLQSGRFITELEPLRYAPGIGATIGINGIRGRAYRLEASTNLLNWTNIFRFTNTVEEMFFTDTNAVAHPHRFYRVIAE